jgi:hypothetical protein
MSSEPHNGSWNGIRILFFIEGDFNFSYLIAEMVLMVSFSPGEEILDEFCILQLKTRIIKKI